MSNAEPSAEPRRADLLPTATAAAVGEPAGPLQVRVVDQLADLAAHEGDWNRLVEQHPRALPFSSYAWMATFFEHRLRPGERWICVLAWRGGELAGVLPLVVRRAGAFPGAGLVAATPEDEHTICVDLLARHGLEGAVAPALLKGAFEALPGCRRIEFSRLPTDSATVELAREGGLRCPTILSFAAMGAYLPVEGDFAAYRGSLSRNFRNNISKAANKLGKSGKAEWIFHTGAEAREQDLRDFVAVEAANWKGDSGTAIGRSPELVAFYSALCRRLATAGWLQWQLLRLDDRLIAGNLTTVIGRRMLVWKLGYDESVSKLSPGTLLLERVVQRSFEQHGATGGEINLLTNYPWYDNWEMRRRRYETLQVYRPGLAGHLLGYWPRRAANAARQIPPLTSAARAAKRLLAKLR
jgi:CelD/BcsL family acetyltransferase involved in cellulose biosynthesis